MSPARAPPRIQSLTLWATFCARRTCGLVSVTSSNGASQASISRFSSGLITSQMSTMPGTASGIGLRSREHRVDRCEQGRAGPERVAERNVLQLPFDAPAQPIEAAPHLVEFERGGPLEREDRLFLVADREDRARNPTRAGPDKEFAGQGLDDPPLPRTRVLRLIDQHMVD